MDRSLSVRSPRGLERGRELWLEQGREQGELRAIIKSSIRKFCKNISANEAADMLEENAELIERIYDAAEKCAPDYDVDKFMPYCSSNRLVCNEYISVIFILPQNIIYKIQY